MKLGCIPGELPVKVRAGSSLRLLVCLAALAVCAWELWPSSHNVYFNPASLTSWGGNAYSFQLEAAGPLRRIEQDFLAAPTRSGLVLLENGLPLGPAHALHQEIVEKGHGRYSHWNGAVIFSSRDNSNPAANGRSYEAVVAVKPARFLTAAAALTLILVAALTLIRISRSGSRALLPGFRLFCSFCATLALLATIAASLSRLFPFHLETRVPANAAIPVSRDNWNFLFVADLPDVKAYYVPLPRLVAPFITIPSPADGEDTVSIGVDWYRMKLRQARDEAELRTNTGGAFIDLDKMYGDGLLLRPGAASPPPNNGAVVIRFPVRVTVGGIGILCALFGLFAMARWSLGSGPKGPSFASAVTWWAVLIAAFGVMLIGINLFGHFQHLRGFSTNDGHLTGPFLRTPGGTELEWQALLQALPRRAGESNKDYAIRINELVSGNVRHIWNYANEGVLRLHVPIWENYILWLLGEIRDDYRRYTFVDARKALERGVGMCSQTSLIVTALLREGGLDTRVAQLGGHTVVTAEVAPAEWYVLDPDIGVVIPKSLKEIERDLSSIRSIYEDGYRRQSHYYPELASEIMVSIYGPEGNSIEPPNANVMMGDRWVATERLAYQLKWALPLALLGAAVLVGGIGWQLRRRRG